MLAVMSTETEEVVEVKWIVKRRLKEPVSRWLFSQEFIKEETARLAVAEFRKTHPNWDWTIARRTTTDKMIES